MIIAAMRSYCRAVNAGVAFVGRSVSYLMPLLAGVVVFEVVSRYFLNRPTIWAYDLSLFLFGYLAALGGAYAQQKRAHINVDILYINVSPRTKRLFNLISYALAIFFLLVLVDMSLGKFQEALEFNYRRESEWAPHMHHFWVMMAVAGTLMAAQYSSDLLADLYYLCTGRHLISKHTEEDENGD